MIAQPPAVPSTAREHVAPEVPHFVVSDVVRNVDTQRREFEQDRTNRRSSRRQRNATVRVESDAALEP
jgi:hypothetical protein